MVLITEQDVFIEIADAHREFKNGRLTLVELLEIIDDLFRGDYGRNQE